MSEGGGIEQVRELVVREMSRGGFSNVADNQMKHYRDMVRAVERHFRALGYEIVSPTRHVGWLLPDGSIVTLNEDWPTEWRDDWKAVYVDG